MNNVLSLGFEMPTNVKLKKSPRCHLSVLTPKDMSTVAQYKIDNVERRWQGKGNNVNKAMIYSKYF